MQQLQRTSNANNSRLGSYRLDKNSRQRLTKAIDAFSKLKECQQCARLTQLKITTKEEKLKLAQHSSHTHSYIDKTGRRTSRHLTCMVFLSSQTLLA
jgi:hypothetical protein